MAVAHDAATEFSTFTTTSPATVSHSPVGTPRGVLVAIDHGSVSTDLITGVTYGGVAMERVGSAVDTTTEAGRVYFYFLGGSIPTGSQTVSIAHTGTATVKHAVVVTVTAAADTEIGSALGWNENTNNLTYPIYKAAAGLLYSNIYSGQTTPITNMALGAGISAIHDHAYGAFFSQFDRETSASSGVFSWAYTPTASDDLAWVVVNIQEVVSGIRVLGSLNPINTNATTSFTIVMEGDLVDKDLYCFAGSRDSTSASGDVTCTDNSGANSWVRVNGDTDKKLWVWRKRGTAADIGATVTVANAVGSTQGTIIVVEGADGGAGDPTTNLTDETNASGNETHAGITPSNDGSLVFFAVFDYGNDTNAITNLAMATAGTMEPEIVERLSTGGNDCRITVTAKVVASGATGNFTWTQTDSTTKSVAFAVRPFAADTIVASVDSDYGNGSEEFDADENVLEINGSNFASCDVYLSDVATLAGGSNEIDISAAIDSQTGSLITLDLTSLTTELADIEALIAAEGHSLFLIVDGTNGEDSIAVTVHRAKAWVLAASANISASGANTTAQLAPPPGKSTSEFGGGRIQDDENPGDTVDLDLGEYREDEWSIEAKTPPDGTYLGAQDGETYDFRVLIGGVVADVITVTPQATISADVEVFFDVEQATEVDEAFDVSMTVDLTFTVEEAIEEDEAFDVSLTAAPVFTIEEAIEVDEALDVSLTVEPLFDVEEAIEVDVAEDVSLTVAVGFALEEAVEVDEAFDVALTAEPLFSNEEATEVDEAFDVALTVEPLFTLEEAVEVDEAFDPVYAPVQSFNVEEATEVDEAFDVTLVLDLVFSNEEATEVDAAEDVSLTVEPLFNVEQATEVDEAFDVALTAAPVFVVEEAVEVDVAFDVALGAANAFDAEQAVEVDVAFDVSLTTPIIFSVEEAIEVDVAEDVTLAAPVLYFAEEAIEVDTAFDVSMTTVLAFIVEQAIEVDVAEEISFDASNAFDVEEAIEVDTAFDVSMTVEPLFVVESATEADVAEDVTLATDLFFTVEEAIEIDEAFDVTLEVDAPDALIFDVEEALEVDQAFDVVFALGVSFTVQQAIEWDIAYDITWEEQIDIVLAGRRYRDLDRIYVDGGRTYQEVSRRS